MLDLFTILTEGGVVLWSKSFNDTESSRPQSAVDALISNLVEGRSGDQAYTTDSHALKWTFANELGLIFVVAWQKILHLTYIDDLLETVKRLFCALYGSQIRDSTKPPVITNFDVKFDVILEQCESKAIAERKKKPRKFEETKRYQNTLEGSKGFSAPAERDQVSEADIAKNLESLRLKGVGPRKGKGGSKSGSRKSSKNASPYDSPGSDSDAKPKERKQMRKWGDSFTADEAQALDYSGEVDDSTEIDTDNLIDRGSMGMKTNGQYNVMDLGDDDDDNEDDDDTFLDGADVLAAGAKSSTSTSGMFGFLKSLTSGRVLSHDDLAPALAKMKDHLMTKNVAADVASHLCDSVEKKLVGQKIGSLQSYQKVVRDSMESSIRQILTPTTSVDLLRDIAAARSQKKPFNICFIGVNGVGKSTNLAKTCFWLLQNNMKVLIAACDTFRSGAVEQLRVHVRNLKALDKNAVVDIYERGYGKDAAGIAKDAITYATANGYDVVMIDTAGRMQDNVPLMRSLAKVGNADFVHTRTDPLSS